MPLRARFLYNLSNIDYLLPLISSEEIMKYAIIKRRHRHLSV